MRQSRDRCRPRQAGVLKADAKLAARPSPNVGASLAGGYLRRRADAPLSQGEVRRAWSREIEQSTSIAQSAKEDLRAWATIGLDRPTSASSRSSSSRSSSYSRRRVIASKSASGNLQNHPRFGEGSKVERDVSVETVVLSQDMFHVRNGAKQRLARKLVGRLYVARRQPLSCSSSVHKRSLAVRDPRPDPLSF